MCRRFDQECIDVEKGMSRMDRLGRRVHVDWEPYMQEVLNCMALTSRIALSIHLVFFTAVHFQIALTPITRLSQPFTRLRSHLRGVPAIHDKPRLNGGSYQCVDVVFSLRRSGQLAQPANAPLNRKAGDLLTYEPWVIWVAHRRASFLGGSQTS